MHSGRLKLLRRPGQHSELRPGIEPRGHEGCWRTRTPFITVVRIHVAIAPRAGRRASMTALPRCPD